MGLSHLPANACRSIFSTGFMLVGPHHAHRHRDETNGCEYCNAFAHTRYSFASSRS